MSRENAGATLIVGGSSGIGLAIAHEFARHGHDILLVARGAVKLNAAAADIELRHGVRAEWFALDVSALGADERLKAVLNQRNDRISYAVLGVGMWCSGPIGDLPAATVRQVLDTNVAAQQAMARMLLPRLNGAGGLLFIGSLAGFVPGPWISAYAASKAALHALILALRQEQSGSGCHICLLAPGVVSTGFMPRAQQSRWQVVLDLLASSPETVARAAHLGLKADVDVILPGLIWRLAWLGTRILPRSMLAWATRNLLRPLAPIAASSSVQPK